MAITPLARDLTRQIFSFLERHPQTKAWCEMKGKKYFFLFKYLDLIIFNLKLFKVYQKI